MLMLWKCCATMQVRLLLHAYGSPPTYFFFNLCRFWDVIRRWYQ
jgi:hypothetical protein